MNRTCGLCRLPGHNRQTCSAPVVATTGSAVAAARDLKEAAAVAYDDEGEIIDPELPMPDMSGMIRGIALLVRGHALSYDEWESAAGNLEDAGWSVVEAKSVAEACRMAGALHPDAIFLDAHPTLGCGCDDTVRFVKELEEAAPISGIAVIAAEWAKSKELSTALEESRVVCFFGYPTAARGSAWISWYCVNQGRKRWSREFAAKRGIELQ